MKTKDELQTMYINSKSNFLRAKKELNNLLKDEHVLYNDVKTAQENEVYHRHNLKIMEAIMEIPEDKRLMNSNKLSIEGTCNDN